MSETKFTPGPHEVIERMPGVLGVIAYDEDGMRVHTAKINGDAIMFDTPRANANLYAAAPEMYEAGNRLYEAYQAFVAALPESASVPARIGIAVVGAKEAWNKILAKARGEVS